MRSPAPSRPLAVERAAAAREMMRECRSCAFRCDVDRTRGPAGRCGCDSTARVFYEEVDWAGEEGVVPTYQIRLSGCQHRCAFCNIGEESQDGTAGEPMDLPALSERLQDIAPSVRSVTISGGEPFVHLDAALEIASRVPTSVRLVWKTNGYASREALSLIEGVPDLILADYKFGTDACAERLAGVPDYTAVLRENLLFYHRAFQRCINKSGVPTAAACQAGSLEARFLTTGPLAAGLPTRKLIVRHLLMPGHFDCCFLPVVDWLAEAMPGTALSLMSGFQPAFRSAEHEELLRMNRPEEEGRARDEVAARGIGLVPWTLAPRGEQADGRPDEIWIDRNGRVCVSSASAELVSCLKRLAPELMIIPRSGKRRPSTGSGRRSR